MCTENPPTLLGKEKCCSIIAKLYEKRKRNLENDKFSSIETPKTSLLGTNISAPERRNAAFNLLKFIKFHQNASNHPYSLNFTNFLE